MVKKKSSWTPSVRHGSLTNQSITSRNLQPEYLGAVIFGCTNNTFAECHARQLFGLPRAHISYVRNIKEGLLSSCSITMTANYMAFMKLQAMVSSVLNQMHGLTMARKRQAILLRLQCG